MKADSLGDRMKNYYEARSRTFLSRRVPVIMRLDGKAFHTFTKGCEKPFDKTIIHCMQLTAHHLVANIQGAKLGYVQSDEISILITDFEKLETDAWFDYNVQKMCSISASMASVYFTLAYNKAREQIVEKSTYKTALFDSRVFNIPKEDVVNCFRWRYQDWLRNSIQMLAQSEFSHAELQKKNKGDLHEMLFSQKGINWNDLKPVYKNGTLILKEDDHYLCREKFNLMNDDECHEYFGKILYPGSSED